MQPLDAERVKEWRHRRMLSQQEVADRAGTSLFTIQRIERGEGNVRPKTGRGVAAALGVPIEELLPKAQAPTSLQLPLNGFVDGLEDERRAVWEADAGQARHLRDGGRARMDDLLAAWRASRERGEPRGARREYMDEMGSLLQGVYDAEATLGRAYIEAALTEGDSEAKVPCHLREESRRMRDLYFELFGLVTTAGLSVRTGADAAAKRGEEVQPEARPYSVEEPEAA